MSQAWIDTISLYRFPLACAVLAVHSAGLVLDKVEHGTAVNSGAIGIWIVEFISMACRLATPSFLVLAGFLFFRDGPLSLEDYRRKIKARLLTLVVPYLAWNLVAVIIRCGPSACKHLMGQPQSDSWVPLSLGTLGHWFAGWPIFPVDAPLWFIRDIFILALLAPLLRLIPRWLHLMLIGGLSVYWLTGPVSFIPGGIPRASSALFFLAGAWMGMNRVVIKDCTAVTAVGVIAGAVFLCSCGIAANLALCGPDYGELRSVLDKLVRFAGATMLLLFAAKLTRSSTWATQWLRRLSQTSFFLFAAHFCVILCISAVWKYLPQPVLRAENMLLVFTVVCLGNLIVCLGCYSFLRRHAPSLLSLLDGNRSGRSSKRLDRTRTEMAIYPVVSHAAKPRTGEAAGHISALSTARSAS